LRKLFKWPCTINENGSYNAPNIVEEGYRDGRVLASPIFVLIVTAINSIEMKPENTTEFEYPTGPICRTVSRKNRKKINLEIFR